MIQRRNGMTGWWNTRAPTWNRFKSELIVMNSGHSAQDHPEAIEEVRRILLEHLRESAD